MLAGAARVGGGTWGLAAVRYQSHGLLDPEYASGGIALTSNAAQPDMIGAALDAHGRLVIVGVTEDAEGRSDFLVARFEADGQLDVTFGSDGFVTWGLADRDEQAKAVLIQPDGRILVVGDAAGDIALIRLLGNGSLDTSFGDSGVVLQDIAGNSDEAYAVGLQSNSTIVVAGNTYGSNWDILVARFSSSGELLDHKTTAISNGEDVARALVIQPNDRILVAGSAFAGRFADVAVVCYLPDLSLDSTFGGDGIVTTNFPGDSRAFGIALYRDGRILVVGEGWQGGTMPDDYRLVGVRYEPDGDLDRGFADNGKLSLSVPGSTDAHGRAAALQQDGKILLAGYAENLRPGDLGDFFLVRLHADGSLDHSWGGDGSVTTDIAGFEDWGMALALVAESIPPTPTPTPTPSPTPDPDGPVFWFYPDDTPYRFMMYQVPSSTGPLMSSGEDIAFSSLPFEEPRRVPDGLTSVYLCVTNSSDGDEPMDFVLWAGDDVVVDTTVVVPGWFSGLFNFGFVASEGRISEGSRLQLFIGQPSGMTSVSWNGSCNDARLVLPGLTRP